MKGELKVQEVPVTHYETRRTITISDITEDDAHVLLEITRFIGGHPDGHRGASDRLSAALHEAGIDHPYHVSKYAPSNIKEPNRGIRF